MIRLSILFIVSVSLFLFLESYAAMGSWLVFVMGYIFISESEWIEDFKKLKRYENRFEHIYVVSNNPFTGEEVWFGDEDLDKLIVRVDYEKVIEQVKKEEKLLEKSGNDFYMGDGLNEKNELKVIPMIFRDGKYVNEDWECFKKERCKNEIMESRKERHELLRKTNKMYYHKYMNYQKGL